MPPHMDNARNANARNANAAPPIIDQEVSHVEFRNAKHMLNQNMSLLAWVEETFCDFVRTNPPMFLGSQTNKDPLNFSDEIKKIFEVMIVIGNVRVELASYQMKDDAQI